MSIATECPHCHKTYRLKDELGGKRATCTGCRQQFVVPMPAPAPVVQSAPARPPADADALALAALSDGAPKKAAEVQAAPAADGAAGPLIVAKCQYCDHVNRFEARMAGKNAPCQNEECRKIIKVPLPVKEEAKDWRVATKPSLAKVEPVQMDGAWGNVQTTAVSRDALKEADAIGGPDIEEPMGWPKRIAYLLATLGVLGILFLGGRWTFKRFAIGRQTDKMEQALKEGDKLKLKPEQMGLIRTLAALLDTKNGKAKDALERLKLARSNFNPANTPERQLAELEIADEMAALAGRAAEAKEGKRIEWDSPKDKLNSEVNAILRNLRSVPGDDGKDLRAHVIRVLTRRLVQREQAELAAKLAGVFPEETGELLAVTGLELLMLGRRDEAEKLARQASDSGTGGASLIALWLALGSPDGPKEKSDEALSRAKAVAAPPGDKTPTLVARVGYAEGLARQGKIEQARNLARGNGKPEERLRAGAGIAMVVAKPEEVKDLEDCANMVEKDLKGKAAPWLLYELVGLSLRVNRPDLAQRFAAAIADPGLRAWAQLDMLRAKLREAEGQVSVAEVTKDVGDANTLAYMLACAAAARHNAIKAGSSAAEKDVRGWDKESLRPFGFAGVALADVPE